jgi:diaminopimelate epimerase
MSKIQFAKFVGAGNDFLVIDAVHGRFGSAAKSWPKIAKAMCNRRYGVGADGILVLEPSSIKVKGKVTDCRMRIFNPDGSEAEMCGNGARCVAAFVSRWPKHKGRVTIETAGGLVSAQVSGTRVTMAMPAPRELKPRIFLKMNGQTWPAGYVDTGVPHAVVLVRHVDEVDVQRIGRGLRFHPEFAPRGANIDFIEIAGSNRLKVRTYERGVEGETLACGTGVAASAVIHAVTGNGHKAARRIQVQTKSGEILTVSLRVDGGVVTDVVMEGHAKRICEGTWQPS